MTGQETRNKLTGYWTGHEIRKGEEFANLTNLIHREWPGVSVKVHKEMKGLETQNLPGHSCAFVAWIASSLDAKAPPAGNISIEIHWAQGYIDASTAYEDRNDPRPD